MSYGPTHQFCHKCNAMLPAHLDECPRCDAKLGAGVGADWGAKEIAQITGTILVVAVVPFCILIGLAVLCANSFQ